VTDSSAIVWARLTASASRNATGAKQVGRASNTDAPLTDAEVRKLHGACPEAPGRIRVRYGIKPDLAGAKATPWVEVTGKPDFTHPFALKGLPADAVVHYAVDTTDPKKAAHAPLVGSFRTAMKPSAEAEVTFAVVTCQMYADLDHADG